MPALTASTKIENPNLSADDWELVAADRKSETRLARAAFRLNEKFTDCVNAGMDRDTVETAVVDVMVQFSDTGATDDEPRAVLTGLLDKTFGKA
jgi:hypothetical protein